MRVGKRSMSTSPVRGCSGRGKLVRCPSAASAVRRTRRSRSSASPAAPRSRSAAPAQEVRKVVTIVFSDLKGSTSMGERLDSEALREVMTRYFDTMRAELERHGGVVEKFIGDAVMAVFGLPRLHEDDALRAVRAAAGMQGALEQLNDELDRVFGVRLANRTGVNTGEVVSGDPGGGPATRDRRRGERRGAARAGRRRAGGAPRRPHVPPRARLRRRRAGRAARAEGKGRAGARLPARVVDRRRRAPASPRLSDGRPGQRARGPARRLRRSTSPRRGRGS